MDGMRGAAGIFGSAVEILGALCWAECGNILESFAAPATEFPSPRAPTTSAGITWEPSGTDVLTASARPSVSPSSAPVTGPPSSLRGPKALLRAAATAILCGLPEFCISRILDPIVFLDEPGFNGIFNLNSK